MIKVKALDNDTPTIKPINNDSELSPEPAQSINNNINDIVKHQAQIAVNLGANVEITGLWAWAKFNNKPSKIILDILKNNNWIWCRNKGKWAYRGVKSASRKTMSWDYIINKYGIEELDNNGTRKDSQINSKSTSIISIA